LAAAARRRIHFALTRTPRTMRTYLRVRNFLKHKVTPAQSRAEWCIYRRIMQEFRRKKWKKELVGYPIKYLSLGNIILYSWLFKVIFIYSRAFVQKPRRSGFKEREEKM